MDQNDESYREAIRDVEDESREAEREERDERDKDYSE